MPSQMQDGRGWPGLHQCILPNLEETYTELTGKEKEANVTCMDTFNIDPSSNPPREWTAEEIAKQADALKKLKKRKTTKQRRRPLV